MTSRQNAVGTLRHLHISAEAAPGAVRAVCVHHSTWPRDAHVTKTDAQKVAVGRTPLLLNIRGHQFKSDSELRLLLVFREIL